LLFLHRPYQQLLFLWLYPNYWRGGKIMVDFWNAIASLIEAIANSGAGAASMGVNFEPEVPEELRK
jgi:cyclic lactone autoinducer peptide